METRHRKRSRSALELCRRRDRGRVEVPSRVSDGCQRLRCGRCPRYRRCREASGNCRGLVLPGSHLARQRTLGRGRRQVHRRGRESHSKPVLDGCRCRLRRRFRRPAPCQTANRRSTGRTRRPCSLQPVCSSPGPESRPATCPRPSGRRSKSGCGGSTHQRRVGDPREPKFLSGDASPSLGRDPQLGRPRFRSLVGLELRPRHRVKPCSLDRAR